MKHHMAIAALAASVQAVVSYKENTETFKTAAKRLAEAAIKFYDGDQPGKTPGLLNGDEYSLSDSALLWQTMIEYWFYTGDAIYNNATVNALLYQRGKDNNYINANSSLSQTVSDVGAWGSAALSAAERGFPKPPKNQTQWINLAENAFGVLNAQWQHEKCFAGGGLIDQLSPLSNQTTSTYALAHAFNLAARLARFTGNTTYSRMADKAWRTLHQGSFYNEGYHLVYSGGYVEAFCTLLSKREDDSLHGLVISGAAAMIDVQPSKTDRDEWGARLERLVDYGHDHFTHFHYAPDDYCSDETCAPFIRRSGPLLGSAYLVAQLTEGSEPFSIIPDVLQIEANNAIAQCKDGDAVICAKAAKGQPPQTPSALDAQASLMALLTGCGIFDKKLLQSPDANKTKTDNDGKGGGKNDDEKSGASLVSTLGLLSLIGCVAFAL